MKIIKKFFGALPGIFLTVLYMGTLGAAFWAMEMVFVYFEHHQESTFVIYVVNIVFYGLRISFVLFGLFVAYVIARGFVRKKGGTNFDMILTFLRYVLSISIFLPLVVMLARKFPYVDEDGDLVPSGMPFLLSGIGLAVCLNICYLKMKALIIRHYPKIHFSTRAILEWLGNTPKG